MAEETTITGLVGEVVTAPGTTRKFRLGRLAQLVISNVMGRYAESSLATRTFHASTAVAGVAPGTALSTTPPMVIWNPLNSGVNISINQVYVGYVSGTLGAGTLVHAFVQQTTAPTGGTELVPVPGVLGSIKPKSRVFQGSTISAAPAIVRPSLIMGAALATTVAFPSAPAYDEVDGSIIIPPGTAWAYQMVGTAGTTPLVLIGVQYEELPFNL
jgi:hypothetical protein